jgi:phenylacetate-CoA ligase
MNKAFVDRVFKLLASRAPAFVYGYGSSIGRIAASLQQRGACLPRDSGLLCVQYTADHMSPAEKGAARDVFGAPVISDYGASEAPGIAAECPNGYLHISVDVYKVEIIDKRGAVLPEGQSGDLVVTSMHNRAMPLIRYRVGDVGKLLPGTCGCGSALPRMKLEIGKSIDTITTSFASEVSAHYLDYINIHLMKRGLHGIAQFKLYQNGIDDFLLHVVRGSGDLDQSVEVFVELLQERLGRVNVRVEELGEIPLEPTGKHRYFVRNV